MPIIRWDPFRDVLSFQNRMNSLFQDYTRGSGESEAVTTASFVPPVDVYEDEHKVVLKLEVPGIKQEDLKINVENNSLTISGERKFEKEEKEENFHRIERRYGNFYRAFTLPSTVDAENIHANYDSGILKVEMLKKAEAKPKQINVSIGPSNAAPAKQVEGTAKPPASAHTAA